MAQYDFGTIDPAVMSGAGLATALTAWRTALNSSHKGPTQPSYRIAGIQWIDDSVVPWVLKLYDGTDWIEMGSMDTSANVFGSSAVPGYIFGCETANDVSDAVNDILFRGGLCSSVATPPRSMYQSADIIKRLDAAWAAGSGNGGLDQGTIANATYHCHRIMNETTGAVDDIFSLSHDRKLVGATVTIATPGVVTWANHGLPAGATFKFSTTGALPTGIVAGTTYYVSATGLTATTFQFSATNGGASINTTGSQSGVHTTQATPLMPSGYTQFRRVASVVRAGATILAYSQAGDEFLLKVQVADINMASTLGVTASLLALTVPIGIQVIGLLSMQGYKASTQVSILITSVDQTDSAVSAASLTWFTTASAGYVSGAYAATLRTNVAGQIRARADTAACSLFGNTRGWIDTRGQL